MPNETPGRLIARQLLAQLHALNADDVAARQQIGIQLRTLGEYDAALQAFATCSAARPDEPAFLIHTATCLMAKGDRAEGLKALQLALRHAPRSLGIRVLESVVPMLPADPDNLAEHWNTIALLYYFQGDIGLAKAAFGNALQARPGHVMSVARLGAITRLGGDASHSESMLRDFLRRNPEAPEVRLTLAEALQREERFLEALTLLNVPAPADPHVRQRHLLQTCSALLGLRRPAEARAVLALIGDPAPDLLAFVQWRRVMLALLETQIEQARALALDIDPPLDLVRDSPLLTEQRIMLNFDMAKLWSDSGDTDRTFSFWQRGHAMLAQMQSFSRAATRGFVDASIHEFSLARMRSGARAVNTDGAPVFVVGMPRSGTTLMEQILDAHPAVFGAGERNAIGELFLRLGGARETAAAARLVAMADQPQLDQASRDALRDLHALAPQASRIVDKMPGNSRYLGLISLLMPKARIIHCVRDPRDIGLSIYTFRFHGHHPYAHDIADLGWYIAQQNRLMDHWKSVLPNPILTVSLRDWVDDFEGTLRTVLHFLDLPFDDACTRFHQNDRIVHTVSKDQVRQPVNARGLNRWQAYARQLEPLSRELNLAGYPLDI